MEIIVCKDYKTLGERAALLFAAQVTEKPTSVFGFATGSSPISTYDYLAKLYEEGAVDFSKAVTYNLDEYYGPHRGAELSQVHERQPVQPHQH